MRDLSAMAAHSFEPPTVGRGGCITLAGRLHSDHESWNGGAGSSRFAVPGGRKRGDRA